MSTDLFGSLVGGVGTVLDPLRRAVEVSNELVELLLRLGIPPESVNDATFAAFSAIVEATKAIDSLAAESSPSLDDILAALNAAGRAFDAVRQLDAPGGPLGALPGVAGDLVQSLVTGWLSDAHPLVHEIASLLTVIELEAEQGYAPPQIAADTTVVRYPYRIERIHLGRIASLLRDPVAVLRAAYVTPLQTGADADAMADALFPKLVNVLRAMGVSCRYGVNPGDEALLAESAPYMNHALIVYVNDPLHDLALEAGFVVSLSSADRGDLGLVVRPFGTLTASTSVGPFTIKLDLTAGVDVFAVGRQGFTLLADASTTEVTGSVSATLGASPKTPGFVFGSPTGSRLEVGGARFAAETSVSSTTRRIALSADVISSALVIGGGDGDGFLADILPTDGLRATFDLGLAYANNTGLTLRGSAGLEATIPSGLALGPVTLSSVHLALQAQGDGTIVAEASASAAGTLGPVHAAVERVGLTSTVTFPPGGGNLGVANLSLGFKPPTGVGLSIDAHGVLTGGGFLSFDPAKGMYAGVMQLSLHEKLTLTAFGLITTKMPDGRPGYSLLVFITVDGFRPIPLGFGFMLQSIGGMLGINRTFDKEVLRAGLKSDSLAGLLFPRDPIGNAPALIQALAAAFPANRGSYLLGLLARITWFTPTLVQLDLALILELGARTRLLVLGRVSSLLPTRDNDLIRLNLDVVGVLDFDEGTLEADAVLLDSRLVHQFPISGDAALRASWAGGGKSGFVLAVGGLNPHFAPPAGFPELKRVAIALTSGNNPRLICEAYFAVTANTIQFGSRVSLYAEALGFSVTGDLGFDVLVTPIPFHFIADFHASVQLKRGSSNLFKVALDGTLEGPVPLHLVAKAKFEILWWSVSVRFEHTFDTRGLAAAPMAGVDVSAALAQELAKAENWSTQLSAGLTHGVALRSLASGSGTVVDPLGKLLVKQQAVPLNAGRDIDTFGGASVIGARRFNVTGALNKQAGIAAQDAFAPARYFTLSDDDKIAAPSFETMDAGLVLGSSPVTFDASTFVTAPLAYHSIALDKLAAPTASLAPVVPMPPATPPAPYMMPVEALKVQRATGSAARVPVRRTGRARFRNTAATPAALVSAPRWRILRMNDGTPATVDPSVKTWSEYRAVLETLNRGGARWQMVPAHEFAG